MHVYISKMQNAKKKYCFWLLSADSKIIKWWNQSEKLSYELAIILYPYLNLKLIGKFI